LIASLDDIAFPKAIEFLGIQKWILVNILCRRKIIQIWSIPGLLDQPEITALNPPIIAKSGRIERFLGGLAGLGVKIQAGFSIGDTSLSGVSRLRQ
jgi:hypothetical protein